MSSSSEQRSGVWPAVLAVLFFSTSPVLIRLADPLSPYEKTAGRLGIAALGLWLLMTARGERLRLRQGDLPLFAGIGLVAALHFGAYVASLNFTTIAHALAIVYTAPIFVALFSAWWLHEPIRPRQWLGVLVTVLGIAVLAGLEPNWTRRMALGDGLALISAITFGVYSVAGRKHRDRVSLLTYTVAAYGLAALWMLPAAIADFTPAGYTLKPLLAVLALGIFPLGIGHTLYNAALRRTHATTVNLIATQEVTLGILLGALLLNELPRSNEIIGALITLLGIALVLV